MLPPSPATTSGAPLREGDLLGGRYRIDATVRVRRGDARFDATDRDTGTRVSAHLIVAPGTIGALDGESARTWLLAGARRARALTGHHVAKVLAAGVTLEGHPWIVSEHIASATLAAHIGEHGAIPIGHAVEIALAVCDALAEMHGAGIVHGSLGPHAVHVGWSPSGLTDVKVTGAGTAQAEAALTLGLVGDVECIVRSPEQLRHHALVDQRADVWALGVLLHTMLAGTSPFAADTPSGASLSVILDEPPPLLGVPPDLANVVRGALVKDPGRRPQTMVDLATALARFATNPARAFATIADRRLALPPLQVLSTAERVAKAHDDARTASDFPPSVRDLPVARSAASARPVKLSPTERSRELPTQLVPQPKWTFRRRHALRTVGLLAAAASVAVLVLVGTEGARIARRYVMAASSHGDGHHAHRSEPIAAPDLPPIILLPEDTSLTDPRIARTPPPRGKIPALPGSNQLAPSPSSRTAPERVR
jgi:serine/threonine protein kinase